VAHNSQVDESLFGEAHHVTKRNEMLQEKWTGSESPIEKEARKRSAGKQKRKNGKTKNDTIQVITKDLIRNLVVPREDPSGQSLVMTYDQYLRIREAAQVMTPAERLAQMEAAKRSKDELMEQLNEQKDYMKRKDLERMKNEKLSELEEEEQEKREYLQKRANQMRQEQEDEIKYLNELILNAKCHAIRDAQIVEKKHIRGEMTDEEKRLDQMMEEDRLKSIVMQQEIENQRREERYLGAMKVMEQIQENEQNRLLELERKDQENRLQQKYLDKLCEEEADRLNKRKQEQERLREELNQCNDEIIERREVAKQQEKLLEQKVLEYQQQKAEREAAFEAEQERIRIEKEKEVAKLRAQQERARDEQAERDALRAKRAQEQAERDWRKKEAEESRKKAETESMLKVARTQQMEQKEHFLAVQAQRERADFERVLIAQQELVEKEKREEVEKVSQRRVYADDVRDQIKQKEGQRIVDRQAFFEEGVKLDEEAKLRRAKLNEVKRKKLEELRSTGIDIRYVQEVARKANVPIGAN